MTNESQDPATVPYQEITDDSYALEAAKTFSIEEPRRGMRFLHGPCPRCCAVIDIPLMTDIFGGSRWSIAGILNRRAKKTGDDDPVHPVMCVCDKHDHAGRPENSKGCGAYWNFIIRTTSA